MLLPISKGWDIDFSREEKRVLYRFIGLYTGSLFVLFAVIAWLYYSLAYSYMLDERRHAMQLTAHRLSSKIIAAHMGKHHDLDLNRLAETVPYRVSFFDKEGACLGGVCTLRKFLGNKFAVDDGKIRITDKSSFGHLGVDAIVLEESGFGGKVSRLRRETLLLLAAAYLVIALVGYFLARLFIRPIQMRRQALDDFIKESTHELNTPISALLMSVDARGVSTDKNDLRIKISARRISDIYKDLTYLFLRDKERIQPESVDMTQIVREQVEALKPLAQKKDVVFHEEYHSPLVCEIDRESALRLVTNLLSNAIKYNRRRGAVYVEIKGRELSVRDTGIGIAEKDQKEIFKRFFRATSYSGGFGLGLSIVSDIAERYHIDVDLESVEGEGTTFRLRFP